jgi:surface antigen
MTGIRVLCALLACFVALATVPAHAAPARKPAQGINCVQFIKSVSDVELAGNAWKWWEAAAADYQRGHQPRPGAIMVFKQSGRMVHGHVAMVSEVLDPRSIRIDHANWAPRGPSKGKVDRGVVVQDISDRNDWSLVRVWYEPADQFGRPYPVFGFIYSPRGGEAPAEPSPAVPSQYRGFGHPDARSPEIPLEPTETAEDSARTVGVATRPANSRLD